MITLCGFPVSNYYNKVKIALVEKNVAFAEESIHPKDITDAAKADTPLGKVPYLRTPQGSLSESQAILEYIDTAYPSPALLPADPFAAAKARELGIYIDLHLELVARELYGQAFFGGTISDSAKDRVHKQLIKNISAFKQLAKFSPFVAGDTFTQADCSAYVNLPVVGIATKSIYGEDLLIAAGVDYKPYLKMISERPSAQKADADRRAYLRKPA